MTIDIDRAKRRSEIITEYLDELAQLSQYSSEEILKDLFKYRAAERLQELIIQSSLDLGRYVLRETCQVSPQENSDVFMQMSRAGMISKSLGTRLGESAKFRNILAHLYDKVDSSKVVAYVQNILRDYPQYVLEVQQYLSTLEIENE